MYTTKGIDFFFVRRAGYEILDNVSFKLFVK